MEEISDCILISLPCFFMLKRGILSLSMREQLLFFLFMKSSFIKRGNKASLFRNTCYNDIRI